MKRAVIIHCWGGMPNYCWYPQTTVELEAAGFSVVVPEMPDTDHPRFDAWLAAATQSIGEPDEDLYLIGHSLGCITILRYLERLQAAQRVGGIVLVAGFAHSLGSDYSEVDSFFQTPVNVAAVRTRAGSIVAIHSDNDPYVPMEYGEELKATYGAELMIKHQMGHFSGRVDSPESCTSLPDVSAAVIRMSEHA